MPAVNNPIISFHSFYQGGTGNSDVTQGRFLQIKTQR